MIVDNGNEFPGSNDSVSSVPIWHARAFCTQICLILNFSNRPIWVQKARPPLETFYVFPFFREWQFEGVENHEKFDEIDHFRRFFTSKFTSLSILWVRFIKFSHHMYFRTNKLASSKKYFSSQT